MGRFAALSLSLLLAGICALRPAVHGQDAPSEVGSRVTIYSIGHGVTVPEALLPPSGSTGGGDKPKAKFVGTIKLTLFVDSKGQPQDIRIVRALGLGLDEHALKMVAAERFKPAMFNNQPVAVGVSLEVTLPIYGKMQEDRTGNKAKNLDVGAPLSQKFSDWPEKPKEAVLGPIPVCRGVL
jgi:hypothetical protein